MSDLRTDESKLTYYDPSYAKLLPPCLTDIGIDLQTCSLVSASDGESGTQTLTYSIEWEDAPGTEKKFVDLLENAQKTITLAALKEEVSTGSREVAPLTSSNSKVSKKSSKSLKKKKKKRHSKKCKWSTSKKAVPSLHTESSEEILNESSDAGCSTHRFDSNNTLYDNLSDEKSKKSTKKSSKTSTSTTKTTTSSSLPSIFGEKEKKRIASSTTSESSLQFSTDFTASTNSTGSVYEQAVSSMMETGAVLVKMVLIETKGFKRPLTPIRVIQTRSTTFIQDHLLRLLGDQYPDENPNMIMRNSSIYFAFRDDLERQKLRRIRQTDIDKLICAHLPRLPENSVCLVIDLIDLVAEGKKVALEFD